jgi:hypothetical protein
MASYFGADTSLDSIFSKVTSFLDTVGNTAKAVTPLITQKQASTPQSQVSVSASQSTIDPNSYMKGLSAPKSAAPYVAIGGGVLALAIVFFFSRRKHGVVQQA